MEYSNHPETVIMTIPLVTIKVTAQLTVLGPRKMFQVTRNGSDNFRVKPKDLQLSISKRKVNTKRYLK